MEMSNQRQKKNNIRTRVNLMFVCKIFVKTFFIMLTKAAFIWTKYSKNYIYSILTYFKI